MAKVNITATVIKSKPHGENRRVLCFAKHFNPAAPLIENCELYVVNFPSTFHELSLSRPKGMELGIYLQAKGLEKGALVDFDLENVLFRGKVIKDKVKSYAMGDCTHFFIVYPPREKEILWPKEFVDLIKLF